MKIKFLYTFFLKPYFINWFFGAILTIVFSVSFIALPSFSGWFLTVCAIVFATGNTTFSYLFPAGFIRLLALIRTITRYFEKTKNHKSALKTQDKIRLHIFKKLSKTSYYYQQNFNHSNQVQYTVHGTEVITNHILLWILPVIGYIISLILAIYIISNYHFSSAIFFSVSAVFIFIILPKIVLYQYKKMYKKLQCLKLEIANQLIQIFESRIEILQYNMVDKLLIDINKKNECIHVLQQKMDNRVSFMTHFIGMLLGILGLLLVSIFLNYNIAIQYTVGIFLLILSLAEMAEAIWVNKANTYSFKNQIQEVQKMFDAPETKKQNFPNYESLKVLQIKNWNAQIPYNHSDFLKFNLTIEPKKWIAILGETGVGKSTFLNSLFYPEYYKNGELFWNNHKIEYLEAPKCIYVMQQAYILSGTLQDNFIGYTESEIIKVLKIVDLFYWYLTLSNGLATFLGENGMLISGGQRKKILLAQSLLKNPELLVIDEPSAGIDLNSTIKILDNIRTQFPDLSILLVTHQKAIIGLVDQVIEME